MANNKRGWCIWVKSLMDKCIDLMAEDRVEELGPLVTKYLDDLRFHRVPWQLLVVSSKYKGHLGTKDGYKSTNNNIYQMCTQISKQTGHVFTPGARIKFLVRKGPEPYYLRCVSTDYTADPSTIPVDLLYYLEKQFYNNMEHLCLFHKAHVNIDNLYNHYYQLIQHDETRQYRL
jgi:DNA polymerase elongation subunit (family B)